MEHEERISIAKSICDKLVKIHGKKILTFAVCGATARAKDKKFSDIDLLIVSSEKVGESYKFGFKDTIVEPFFITKAEAETEFTNPLSPEWQKWMLLIFSAKPLYGSEDVIKDLQKIALSIPVSLFDKAAGNDLVLMSEYINHMQGANVEGDLSHSIRNAVEFAKLSLDFVSMLNRKPYSGTAKFAESGNLAKLPSDFVSLMTKLGTSSSTNEILKISRNILENSLKTAEDNGIVPPIYASIEQVKL